MAFPGQLQEPVAEAQAALIDRGIDRGQGPRQTVDFVQAGGAGAVGQQFQFVAQAGQLGGVARVRGPLLEQVVGVDDQVHALGQEHGQDMRIGALAVLVKGLAGGQQARDQRRRVGQGHRAVAQVGQAAPQLLVGFANQGDQFIVGAAAAVDQLLDQFLRRFRQLRHGVDLGHAGAALEGVQSAVHLVVHRMFGEVRIQGIQPLAHQRQIALRLAAEDVQQHRVGVFRRRFVAGAGRLFRRQLEFQAVQVGERVRVGR